MSRPKLTPYQRIVRNAKRGRGTVLSVDETFDLGIMDDAIGSRALVDEERQREAADEARKRAKEIR